MKIIDIPTELRTAFTDLILGLVVVGVFIALYQLQGRTSTPKLNIWLSALGLLGLASLLGSIVHGIVLSPKSRFRLWQPLNLALGLVIAIFVTAAVYDVWGEAAFRKALLPMIGLAGIFYGITVVIPKTFLTFVAFEAAALLFALAGYFFLAVTVQLPGAWWMVAGILITLLAAVVQAAGKNGVVIFLGFDHNGVFHLIQIFGILAFMIGLYISF